jgi:hypothetical protein
LLPLPVEDERNISHPADVGLGPAVRWRGYDLEPSLPTAGDDLRITLYWQVVAPIDEDWTTFIHLLDERGEKVGQVDRLPVGDFYHPSDWRPGLLLADEYELPLRQDLPAGRYRLVFGWYRGSERLDWADGQDARPLAEITVVQ